MANLGPGPNVYPRGATVHPDGTISYENSLNIPTELTELRQMVEKLTLRVAVLENELGMRVAELETPNPELLVERAAGTGEPHPDLLKKRYGAKVVPDTDSPGNIESKSVPAKGSPGGKKGPKSNFVDDGRLYVILDYTEKSFAVFGKSACVQISSLTSSFRMLYTEKMNFGPGATGPKALGESFLQSLIRYITAQRLNLEVINLTRAKMTELFGIDAVAEAK